MSDKEQISIAIDSYMNLLRIKSAQDKETEIDNQLCALRAKLEAFGVMVETLKIK